MNLEHLLRELSGLKSPPSQPVLGRGFSRIELTSDPAIVDAVAPLNNPHVAVVSVRKPVNRFGRIGYPKSVFVSPELFALLDCEAGSNNK